MPYNIKNIISRKPRSGLIFPYLDIRPPSPLFLVIHITLSCNRKCNWCYQIQDNFYRSFNAHMPINAFKKILASFRHFKPHIHIYGGEPLFHPEFPLFLKYSQMYGYRSTLTTNGDYLSKYSKAIIQSSLSQLNISLNGMVGCDGNFDLNLQKIIKDFIMANKGKKIINLNYVIEPGSYKYLKELVSFLNSNYKEKEFYCLALQHLSSGLITDSQTGGIDLAELANLITRIKKMKLKFKLLFLPDIKIGDFKNYYNTKYAFKNKCYVPWLGLNIYPDLTVTPAGGIFTCNYSLGNLEQMSVIDIWNGAKLKNFCSSLIKGELPQTCNRCCHKLYY